MTRAYIGMGANLGLAHETIKQAIVALDRLPVTHLTAQSALFRTAPVEADGADYINAVAQLDTELGAFALLQHLLDLETRFGRQRPYFHAPRTLDLDLLLYGEQCIDTPELTVPHPRMTARAFVLIPLLELDPFISIPGQGAAHRFVSGVAHQAIERIGMGLPCANPLDSLRYREDL